MKRKVTEINYSRNPPVFKTLLAVKNENINCTILTKQSSER